MGRQLTDVGLITLKLFFISKITKRARPLQASCPPQAPLTDAPMQTERLPMLGKIGQKNLKGDAHSHQARLDQFLPRPVFKSDSCSLDKPEYCGPQNPITSDYTFDRGNLFASFNFSYRSECMFLLPKCVPQQYPPRNSCVESAPHHPSHA
jgi:hypothetical protein